MRNLVLIFICTLTFNVLNGQTKKIESVYFNVQGKGGMDFMNPLQLGVSLPSNKPGLTFRLGLSGYYPNPHNNYQNSNYNNDKSFNVSISDTSDFISSSLRNAGFGLSLGVNQDFKLFKKLNLNSGFNLSNMINFRKSTRIHSRSITNNGGAPYFSEELSRNHSNKISYIPFLETYVGGVFNMGKHLLLNPRLNFNMSVHNSDALYDTWYVNQQLSISMRPYISLGYRF